MSDEIPSPTPLEIATLAARLLPPIELPRLKTDPWDALDGDSNIREFIGQLSVLRRRQEDHDLQSPWEAICMEATARARVLLECASGEVGARIQAEIQANRDEQERLEVGVRAEVRKQVAEFKKRFPTGATGPSDEFLKLVMPETEKRPETRAAYWKLFIEELSKNPLALEWIIDFPLDAIGFEKVYCEYLVTWKYHKEAWLLAISQKSGAKGARKKAARKK